MIQEMHRKMIWKGREYVLVECQILPKIEIASVEDNVPINRYPKNNCNIHKTKAKEDLLDYQREGNMDKIILTGNRSDNRKIELSKVCEMCFSNTKLRFVRRLQSAGLQSFLQFNNSLLEGRENVLDNMHRDDTSTCLMKILKLKFDGLEYLIGSNVILENVFKKRKVKISSMREDVPIIRYSEKNRVKLNNFRDGNMKKIILTEGDDNKIKLSKVCEDLIIKQGAKSVNHKEQSLLQFDKLMLVGREFLWNNDDLDDT
jgi:hypothetical protein